MFCLTTGVIFPFIDMRISRLCSSNRRRRVNCAGNRRVIRAQPAGERRFLTRHRGMVTAERLLRHRSDHFRTQWCGQPADERLVGLQQSRADRHQLAQGQERAGLHAERRAQD